MGIIAFSLIIGCSCLSGGCGEGSTQGCFNSGALAEPLVSRDEQRRDIFANSLLGDENEWLCPICAFENRPRAVACSLCGNSQEHAARYYEAIRKQRADSSNPDQDSFRVTLVAPPSSTKSVPFRVSLSDKLAVDSGALVLSNDERQTAFMVRRFNQLSLRQRAAHRRRLWQRRATEGGGMQWVRVVTSTASGGDAGGDSRGGGGGGGDGGLTESLLKNGSNDRDSFGDGVYMAHSPGFTSVLNPSKAGVVGWHEETGLINEGVTPIKQRIMNVSKMTEDDEDRDGHDLVSIAALPFRRKQQWSAPKRQSTLFFLAPCVRTSFRFFCLLFCFFFFFCSVFFPSSSSDGVRFRKHSPSLQASVFPGSDAGT